MHQTLKQKKVNKPFIINIIKTIWNMQTALVSIWSNKQVGFKRIFLWNIPIMSKDLSKKHEH